MATRVVKHLGARSCPADDSKVLLLVPTFPGERIMSVRISAYFASGADSSIDQPGEVNWYGLSIPWSLMWATAMMQGIDDKQMQSVVKFDNLFRDWLRGPAADQRFGGDVDVDPEEVAGEEGHTTEELIDSGPIGVHKWFSREVVMQPYAAEGNNVIRFGDSFTATVNRVPLAAMGSLVMFGVVRFEHATQTTFNVMLDDATAQEAMGLLLAGDYTKVLAKVEGDTSALGDFIRTVLYGGDNYVEDDTLKGPAGKAVVKAKIVIQTSLGRGR